MNSTNIKLVSIVAFLFIGYFQTALAQNDDVDVVYKSFSLNPYGAILDGGAKFQTGFGPHAGISMPKSTSSFAIGFTIPQDFAGGRGTWLSVRMLYHVSGGETDCNIDLRPNFISVARSEREHLIGPGASTGILPTRPLLAPPSNESRSKSYYIMSPEDYPDSLGALMRGDSVIFGFYRSSQSKSDTCENALMIQGLEIFYIGWDYGALYGGYPGCGNIAECP